MIPTPALTSHTGNPPGRAESGTRTDRALADRRILPPAATPRGARAERADSQQRQRSRFGNGRSRDGCCKRHFVAALREEQSPRGCRKRYRRSIRFGSQPAAGRRKRSKGGLQLVPSEARVEQADDPGATLKNAETRAAGYGRRGKDDC